MELSLLQAQPPSLLSSSSVLAPSPLSLLGQVAVAVLCLRERVPLMVHKALGQGWETEGTEREGGSHSLRGDPGSPECQGAPWRCEMRGERQKAGQLEEEKEAGCGPRW